MENLDTKKIVNKLRERKSLLESQTRLHSGLISNNYIVEVGAKTVAKVDGKATLMPIDGSGLPSQWTAAGVKEIKANCSWTNMQGKKMQIKAINYKDWYAKEIELINETLEIFEPLVK